MTWRIPQFDKSATLRRQRGWRDFEPVFTYFEVDFRRYYNASLDTIEWQYWSNVTQKWITYAKVNHEVLDRSAQMSGRQHRLHSILAYNVRASRALAEMRFYKVERVDQNSARTT